MLWKAADQHSPPEESVNITNLGWEFKDDIPIPVIDHSYPVPSELFDIIKVCGCHKGRISCTVIVPAKMDVAIHSRSEKNL